MRSILPIVFVAFATAAPAVAAAQDCRSPNGRHVRVSGSATLRVPPDRVSFSVGVESTHPNVSEAFRANGRKVEAVIAALKAKGVQAAELQTSGLDISSRNPDGTPAKGYRVANRVTVTRERVDGVGELIEAAVAAGANEASQLSFFVADPSAAQGQGLDQAFAAARAKAETLAKLAGQRLGEALCVSESGGVPPPMPMARFQAAQAAVEPGTEAITFGVEVVFQLGNGGGR